MKQQIVYALLLLSMGNSQVQAQLLSPQTVNSTGNYKAAGNIQLEDAVGSLLVNTVGTGTSMYTQGFIQPDAGTTTSVVYINDVTFNSGSGPDNAGASLTNGNLLLEFTLGEYASITQIAPDKIVTQGLLQPYENAAVLPVTGLEFFAKRISNTQVQLEWKTLQEFNNKGFTVERKKDSESNFGSIGFVSSKAIGGNSSFTLDYQKTDNNNYTGKTYYRIKQVDLNGQYTYSVTRLVNGDNSVTLQVWPVPSTGPVNVMVSGLQKPDQLQVFNAAGQLLQRDNIQNNQTIQLKRLPAGSYFVRLADNKELMQKIVIQ